MNVRRNISAALGVGLAVAGCHSSPARSQVEMPVIEANYHIDGSDWSVACYGPVHEVTAQPGDFLLHLVLNGVDLVQTADLAKKDVPQQAYLQAVAEMNGLEDINSIVAYVDYDLPSRCQPQ